MNADQFRKNVGHRVRLRPQARRPASPKELPRIDDEWMVEGVEPRGTTLRNLRTDHAVIIGWDHLHSFHSDPGRDADGIRRGFARLRVQVFLHADGRVEIEPLEPGKWDSLPEPKRWRFKSPRLKVEVVPISDSQFTIYKDSSELREFLASSGGFAGSLTSHEHLHPDRAFGNGDAGYEVELDFPWMSRKELEFALKALISEFEMSADGVYTIEQSQHSWSGIGASRFLESLADRNARYAQISGSHLHHSEDFTYFAESRDNMVVITGRQRAEDEKKRPRNADYYSLEISLLLPGMPLDTSPIKRFTSSMGKQNVILRPRSIATSNAFMRSEYVAIEPVAYVLKDNWIGNVIAANPYFGKPESTPKDGDGKDAFRQLADLPFILCSVHDHFPISHHPVNFKIFDMETTTLGHRRLFNVGCRWEECPECEAKKPGHPADSPLTGLLKLANRLKHRR
jgi:hypothetical protein